MGENRSVIRPRPRSPLPLLLPLLLLGSACAPVIEGPQLTRLPEGGVVATREREGPQILPERRLTFFLTYQLMNPQGMARIEGYEGTAGRADAEGARARLIEQAERSLGTRREGAPPPFRFRPLEEQVVDGRPAWGWLEERFVDGRLGTNRYWLVVSYDGSCYALCCQKEGARPPEELRALLASFTVATDRSYRIAGILVVSLLFGATGWLLTRSWIAKRNEPPPRPWPRIEP
jgi:hypothetical protein